MSPGLYNLFSLLRKMCNTICIEMNFFLEETKQMEREKKTCARSFSCSFFVCLFVLRLFEVLVSVLQLGGSLVCREIKREKTKRTFFFLLLISSFHFISFRALLLS
eukprot:gene5228-3743_t